MRKGKCFQLTWGSASSPLELTVKGFLFSKRQCWCFCVVLAFECVQKLMVLFVETLNLYHERGIIDWWATVKSNRCRTCLFTCTPSLITTSVDPSTSPPSALASAFSLSLASLKANSSGCAKWQSIAVCKIGRGGRPLCRVSVSTACCVAGNTAKKILFRATCSLKHGSTSIHNLCELARSWQWHRKLCNFMTFRNNFVPIDNMSAHESTGVCARKYLRDLLISWTAKQWQVHWVQERYVEHGAWTSNVMTPLGD